jgi:hypothetical protein
VLVHISRLRGRAFPVAACGTSIAKPRKNAEKQCIIQMELRFEKHYTREEARAMLPEIRRWLARLNQLRKDIEKFERRLSQLAVQSTDIGGETVNDWIRALADMQQILVEFQRRQIFIKDLDRGLIDFPAIIGGREVFLCWEADEDDVEFWHDLESGFGGRERLEE